MHRVWGPRGVAVLAALALVAALAPAAVGDTETPGTPLLVTVERGGPAFDPPGLETRAIGPDVYVVEVPAVSAASATASLEARPEVVRVTPDLPVELAAAPDPDDPLFDLQWGVHQVNAPAVWEHTTGSPDTVIAVVDTGVDGQHPDLEGGVLQGWNTITDQPGGDWDPNGHGTVVAGIAAARGDDGYGIAGMCWACTILPVRAMDEKGKLAPVLAGIYWAADHGADIINLSLGTGNLGAAPDLQDAVDHARAQGALVVAAAGNENSDDPFYPAALPGVLAVGGNEQDEVRWTGDRVGSGFGPWVDVSAAAWSYWENDETVWTGTSMAAPLVAGALALAREHNDDPRALGAAARQTAQPIGDWVERGRLDAERLVQAAALAAGVEDEDWLPEVLPRRMSGRDRYRTAANLAQETFEPGVERVYLATGADYPDGLAAGAVAASTGAPVLLTRRDRLDAAAAEALHVLEPEEIVVVGGPAAISEAVVTEVAATVEVTPTRIAGTNRYETAAALAGEVFEEPEVVYLATGEVFADALAVGPAGARLPGPVLLTRSDSLHDATRAAFADLMPTRVVAVGGTQAIADRVLNFVEGVTGVVPERWWGDDRYETAAAIAEEITEGEADRVMLASGLNFPDALASGAAAPREDAPLLLVRPTRLPDPTATALMALEPTQVIALGGQSAVAEAVLEDALAAVIGP